MSKLTDADWWMGRTDEQQARKQTARDGWEDDKAKYRADRQARKDAPMGLLAKASIGMFALAVVLFAVSLLG